MKLIFNRKTWGVLFWIWGLAIFIASSIPDRENKVDLSHGTLIRMDYLVHFGLFFILSMFFVFWKTSRKLNLSKVNLLGIILGGSLFALVDEWHQQFIPGRSFNIYDFFADVTGLIAGTLIIYYLFIRTFLFKSPLKQKAR